MANYILEAGGNWAQSIADQGGLGGGSGGSTITDVGPWAANGNYAISTHTTYKGGSYLALRGVATGVAPTVGQTTADWMFLGPASLPIAPFVGAFFEDVAAGATYSSLYVLTSLDGKQWDDAGPNFIFNPATGVRDPSLVFLNGQWFVAYTGSTGGSHGTSFGVASSPDLVTWTKIAEVDCSAATAAAPQNPGYTGVWTWAPEWFVDDDGSVYIVVSINDSTLYYLKATNAALTTWSAPTVLPVTGIPSYVIDADIIKIGNTYHLFYKNETTKLVGHATATTVLGPYTVDGEIPTTATSGGTWPVPDAAYGFEGPDVVQVGPTTWRIYVDQSSPTAPGLMWAETTDPTLNHANWSALTAVTPPSSAQAAGMRLRHGDVVAVGGTERAPLGNRKRNPAKRVWTYSPSAEAHSASFPASSSAFTDVANQASTNPWAGGVPTLTITPTTSQIEVTWSCEWQAGGTSGTLWGAVRVTGSGRSDLVSNNCAPESVGVITNQPNAGAGRMHFRTLLNVTPGVPITLFFDSMNNSNAAGYWAAGKNNQYGRGPAIFTATDLT